MIQDVDEFVSWSEHFWRNVGLNHLLTNGSTEVNGCRQNESCGLLVDYYVFICFLDSFWRHPFTAEDSLVSKWFNAQFLQTRLDESNSSTPWIAWG